MSRSELTFDFSGKTVVVTGASSGIGRAAAIALSNYGAKVVLCARSEERLKETLSLLSGQGHLYACIDFADHDGIEEKLKAVVSETGAVDGLVYAAGIDISLPLQQFKPDKAKEVFAVNYFGFLECVRALCRKGRFNPGMHIVALSSIAAKVGDKTHTVYSASKAALDASVRCLAKELADREIRINTIAPAMTDTNIYTEFCAKHGDGAVEELIKRQYLGIAKVEDVANAICFLLSSASGFMTGSCLSFDGGFTSC